MPLLAVVIPALDAAATLPATLAALAPGRDAGLVGELVVVDGGSADATRRIAAEQGARVICAPRGRGPQLAAGVAETTLPWLLLLHADTRLAAGWSDAVADWIGCADSTGRAAHFRFALDDDTAAARRLERIVAWRCRVLALPYGDQGLVIARAHLARVGGVRPLVLMEDVDLVRRIGRANIAALSIDAVTSAARWRRDGYLRRSARNLACLALWRLGVDPAAIRRLYG